MGGARTRKNAIKGEIREYQKEVELAFAHDRKIHRAADEGKIGGGG